MGGYSYVAFFFKVDVEGGGAEGGEGGEERGRGTGGEEGKATEHLGRVVVVFLLTLVIIMV